MQRSTVMILIMGLILSAPATAAETALIDGVPHVRNGSQPAEGRRDIHLKELWRVGGDDEEILFGAVGQILADEEQNLYLMDSQLREVSVFSPEGEFLRTLGRQGDGPGEVQQLGNMFFMPDGQLALVQDFPGKVVTINRDGTPGHSFRFQAAGAMEGTFGVLVAGGARGGSMILTGISMRPSGALMTQNHYMSLCDSTGRELHSLFQNQHAIDFSGYIAEELSLDFVWSRWALSPDGRLYVAPERNKYRIQIHKADGTLERVIEREYESYNRNAEEKKLVRRHVEAIYNNYPQRPNGYNVEKTDPDIANLRVAPNGELWVSTSRGTRDLPEGIAIFYDIFDAEGRFARQVAVHGAFDPDRDLYRFLGQDRFVVVIGAGEGYLNSMGVSSDGDGEAAEVPLIEAIVYEIG